MLTVREGTPGNDALNTPGVFVGFASTTGTLIGTPETTAICCRSSFTTSVTRFVTLTVAWSSGRELTCASVTVSAGNDVTIFDIMFGSSFAISAGRMP